MSVRFCQKCGITVDEGDVYCHSCGAELQIKIPGGEDAPEVAEYCARCGLPLYAGDRFCSNCGTDRSRPKPPRVHDEYTKGEYNPSRRDRLRGMFKIAFAFLFWGSIFAGCYMVYRYLGSDIPWGEVVEVVAEQRRDAGVPRRAAVSDDLLSPDIASVLAALPPIVPEAVSFEAPFPDAPQIRELAPIKLAWGAQDEDGISVLVLSDGAPALGLLSFPGSVSGGRVRLRAEPSTKAHTLGVLKRGDRVDIVRRFSSGKERFVWYNVRTERGVGWMYGEFVRVIEDE
ncbi:MAG: SH3 domain-containing protein [Synergistaceae bacterium]|jgi:uncharacterized Zn finger protein (UPF0148 family)|nr:SH3 domain-containing protein [Synergistaceae bacterium]